MSYENPQVPHEVNVSRENPLTEFFQLALGLALVVVVISVVLYFAGSWLARLIPFASEQSWVGDQVLGIAIEAPTDPQSRATEGYLRDLTNQLSEHMDLPEDMTLTVHYTAEEVPNAFATLGGHIVVTSGLYQRMPSENALAMVLAHEIAHIRARDPIAGIGGAATLTLMLSVISGDVGDLTPYAASVVQLGYSRQAESDADTLAIEALKRHYGHAGGAATLFEVLKRFGETQGARMPSLLSTHPADDERFARLQAAAGDWNAAAMPLLALRVTAP